MPGMLRMQKVLLHGIEEEGFLPFLPYCPTSSTVCIIIKDANEMSNEGTFLAVLSSHRRLD